MNVEMPRVWNGLRYDRRLHPLSMNVNQSLEPLSTANMILPDYDEIHALDWVQISTPDGKTEYYRVASVDTEMTNGQKEVYLEHGACSLGDAMIPEVERDVTTTSDSAHGASLKEYPENLTDTISNLLDHILDFQGTEYRWAPGTVQATQTIYIELGGMSPLAAISSMMRYIPDYQLEFVQDGPVDWTVNVIQRPSTPVCEGRLNRNLRTCEVSYDVKDICTRVYCKGLGHMDSNTALYGVHAETKNLSDNLSNIQKSQILQSYLNNRDHPIISVNISGVELSQITGLPIDKFVIGTVCRIAIPWLGVTENEIIIEKGYDDVLKNPDQVTVVLANAKPDLAITMAKVNNKTGGGGGGGGGGQQEQAEKEKKRYETWFEQTDRYLKLLATDSEWDEAGERHVTAFGQIQVQSDEITYMVEKTGVDGLAEGETLYSHITQTADALTSEVGRAQGEEALIRSTITQTAGEIRSEVTAVDGRVSTISQTVDGINISGNTINIKGNTVNLGDYVTVANLQANYATITDLDSVTAEINNLKGGVSQFSLVSAGSVAATAVNCSQVSTGSLYVGGTNVSSVTGALASATISESGGVITLTTTTIGGGSSSSGFNMAATTFYQNAVAAAKAEGEAQFQLTSIVIQGSQVPTSSRRYLHLAGAGRSFSFVANTTLYYNRGSGYESAGSGMWYLGGSGTAYYEDGGYEYFYPNGTYYYAGSAYSNTYYTKRSS